MPKYTQEKFDSELRKMLQEARNKGQRRCEIIAKDLHDRVVRKSRTNQMRMACEAMRKLWKKQGSHEDNITYLAPSNKSDRNKIEFDTDLNGKIKTKKNTEILSSSTELERFIDELIEQSREKGYIPKAFINMRGRYGTVKAIKRLVDSKEIQSGFRRLQELDLLHLSVEAAVLKFPNKFTFEEQEVAKWRLEKADDDAETTHDSHDDITNESEQCSEEDVQSFQVQGEPLSSNLPTDEKQEYQTDNQEEITTHLVYQNWTVRRGRVHVVGCKHYKKRGGGSGRNSKWYSCSSYQEARSIMNGFGYEDTADCSCVFEPESVGNFGLGKDTEDMHRVSDSCDEITDENKGEQWNEEDMLPVLQEMQDVPKGAALSDEGEKTNGKEVENELDYLNNNLFNSRFWRKATTDDVIKFIATITDINARDINGNTSLHWAVRCNRKPEVIALLLDREANPLIYNHAGKTPFDYIKGDEHLKNSDVYLQLKGISSKSTQSSTAYTSVSVTSQTSKPLKSIPSKNGMSGYGILCLVIFIFVAVYACSPD